MPEFQHVAQPSSIGSSCALCQTHQHERGFVNLTVERPGFGFLHACAGCIDTLAALVGCLAPGQAQALRLHAAKLGETIVELRAELERAHAAKVVPLAEVLDLVKARQHRAQAAKPEPKAAA